MLQTARLRSPCEPLPSAPEPLPGKPICTKSGTHDLQPTLLQAAVWSMKTERPLVSCVLCTSDEQEVELGVCRVLRELLGSAVAGRQGEPLQRKHLLSKALKRAHNSLGEPPAGLAGAARPCCMRHISFTPIVMCHHSTCKGSLHSRTSSQGCSADHMMMPGALS